MSKSESEGSEGHVVVSPLESLPLHVFSHSARVLSRVFTQPVSYQGVDAGQSDGGDFLSVSLFGRAGAEHRLVCVRNT